MISLAVSAPVAAGQPVSVPAKPIPLPPSDVRPLPPAAIDDSLAIGGENIKARLVERRLTVDVRVNGRGPYRFLVDSGADSSVVGMRIARELNLRPSTPVILNSMTGRTRVARAVVDELSFGTTAVHDLHLPVLLERDLGGDGIIGIDALVEQRLMLDFEKRLIKVEDARQRATMERGEIVVTARRRRGQLILTEVRAAGRSMKAVIDTGSDVTIGNLKLRDALIRGNRDKFVPVEATDVTGAKIMMQLAVVAELRVGKVTLHNVPIAFADAPPFQLFGLAQEPAMLLGSDLLETFRRVSLDFRARKVRFQLRRCGSTGISIGTAPAAYSRISSDAGGDVCRR
jgi:predicted aspartyl protease